MKLFSTKGHQVMSLVVSLVPQPKEYQSRSRGYSALRAEGETELSLLATVEGIVSGSKTVFWVGRYEELDRRVVHFTNTHRIT